MVQLMAPFRSSTSVDPGWEHGISQDDRKKKVKCNYCGKIVSGGIYRLKQHLARVSGEVTYCDKAPEDVYRKMKQNLEGSRSSRKPPRLAEDEEQAYLNLQYEEDDDDNLPAPSSSCPVSRRSKGKQLMASDRSLMVGFLPVRLGYVDPGWEHGVAQDERKKKVKCNYCDKVVSGGINRFKQHLAKIPGEVASCKNAPEEVYMKMKENMKWHRTGRRQRPLDSNEISEFCKQTDEEQEDDQEQEQEQDDVFRSSKDRSTVGEKRPRKDWKMALRNSSSSPVGGSEAFQKKSRLDSVFLNNSQLPPSRRELKVKNGWSRRSRRDVVSSICKFFYQAGVPPEAANSQQFHKMLEVVSQYGHGVVGPQSQVISDRFLQEEIATIKKRLLDYKASWATTGCSILADSWIDVEGRASINLLVSCPRGLYFVASVDGTEIVDALSLFRVLDKVVEEMGEGNVIQVITDNTPSFKTAGKMLEEKRNLFWTPCATYCIDQMLDEFSRINTVQECIVKAQKITKLIYNSIWLLNIMKEFTQGQELLRIGPTRCASSFATLQCLLDFRTSIRRMFQSSTWISSGIAQTDEGKEVGKIVSNGTFWKKVQCACRSVEPVIRVLQKVHSGENRSMPFVYNNMLIAKLAIKSIHGDDACKYGPFWSVLDNHWGSLSHHPLYLAAYFLNPSFRYCSDFVVHSEMVRGLNDCILRLEPDNSRRISASRQISDYNAAKGDFGTELAISTRAALDPAAWWEQHGISCSELQRIAVRILSQTSSSFGCEHWWSIYDRVHIRRQNRIAQKKLDDLIFVHYNMRLQEEQTKRSSSNDSISVDSLLAEHLLGDWIVMEDGGENELMDYEGLEGLKAMDELLGRTCEVNGNGNPPQYDASRGGSGSGSGSTEDGEEEEDDNFLNEDLSEELEN